MELESELIGMIYRRPSLRSLVYSLGSSATTTASNDDHGEKIDCTRVQNIVTTNTFGAPLDDQTELAWERFKGYQSGKSSEQLQKEAQLKGEENVQ